MRKIIRNGIVTSADELSVVAIDALVPDQPFAAQLNPSIFPDHLIGDGGNDYFNGQQGNDTIEGLGGNDTLVGGIGNDLLFGGDAEDFLAGGAQNDTIIGGTGNDWMFGDDGADSMTGDSGADNLYGNGGDDVAKGGEGDDTLRGDDGNDNLSGGLGNDVLEGESGDDIYDLTEATQSRDFAQFDYFETGHDTVEGFDRANDVLMFYDVSDITGDGVVDFKDINASSVIVDGGLLGNVTVNFFNGDQIVFAGAGNGHTDRIEELVNNPATQLMILV